MDLKNLTRDFRKEIAKVIIGQEEVVKNVLISIFSQGHCFISRCSWFSQNFIGSNYSSVFRLKI